MGKVKRQPEVLGYSAAGGYPRKDIDGPRGATDEETGRNLAALLTGPAVAAYRVIRAAEVSSGIGDMLDVPTLLEHLRADAKAVQEGSLAQAEAMLANQAVALQSLFARLAERGMGCDTAPAFEANMRYALRAQSQCRATLETLALIKQGPAVYARQANIAHGPQQVNNGASAEVRPGTRAGRKAESQHPELLRTGNGERLDTGTAGTAGRGNPPLEAVGAVNRAEDAGR
jgi:hypothetical protein